MTTGQAQERCRLLRNINKWNEPRNMTSTKRSPPPPLSLSFFAGIFIICHAWFGIKFHSHHLILVRALFLVDICSRARAASNRVNYSQGSNNNKHYSANVSVSVTDSSVFMAVWECVSLALCLSWGRFSLIKCSITCVFITQIYVASFYGGDTDQLSLGSIGLGRYMYLICN